MPIGEYQLIMKALEEGLFPQTAVTFAVTRQYSPTPLNFAAHSPEDGPTRQEIPFCAPPTDRTGKSASVQNESSLLVLSSGCRVFL
jgi:hypothetical protein